MKKLLLIGIMMITLLSSAFALDIYSGISFTSGNSNTTITFDKATQVNSITVYNDSVYLYNAYIEGCGGLYLSRNFTGENEIYYSSLFASYFCPTIEQYTDYSAQKFTGALLLIIVSIMVIIGGSMAGLILIQFAEKLNIANTQYLKIILAVIIISVISAIVTLITVLINNAAYYT